jgi:hypothetical protein
VTTPTIRFNAALRATKGHAILQLPEAASKKLPSRGQVAVQGTWLRPPRMAYVCDTAQTTRWSRVMVRPMMVNDQNSRRERRTEVTVVVLVAMVYALAVGLVRAWPS